MSESTYHHQTDREILGWGWFLFLTPVLISRRVEDAHTERTRKRRMTTTPDEEPTEYTSAPSEDGPQDDGKDDE